MAEDFYDALGVGRDASEDEIKRAYREKAREYHPDVSDDPDAEEKFKQIQRAKEVLTDEEARQAYDRLGHERFEQARKQGGFDGGGRGAGGMGGDPFGGAGGFGDLSDIFEQFFGGGGGRGRRGPSPGADLRTTLRIDLEDAFEGVEKQLTLTRPERCPACDGSGHPPDVEPTTCPECDGRGQVTQVQQTALGRVQQTTTCRRCGGEGELYDEACGECGGDGAVRRERTLSVDVPAGIRDGQTLRMEGEGGPGEPGAPDGDLLIEIAIREHERFRREGDDVSVVEPVSFPQVVLGDTIEVETLGGSVEMDVPAGTQSGETFRLAGRGMPRLRGRGRGDQYVRVQVVTPDALTDEQREAIEALAEASGEELDVEDGFFEKIRKSL